MTKETRDTILQQQVAMENGGIPFVPHDEMIHPQSHLIDGYCAITACIVPIGIPAGYIGVREGHPLYNVSAEDADKLADKEFGIVYAGFTPNGIDVMEDKSQVIWFFGFDTGNNLHATRQDLIDQLRDIAKFLNSRIGENNRVK